MARGLQCPSPECPTRMGIEAEKRGAMVGKPGEEKPLEPLTPRQKELMRIIQNLDPNARHTLKVLLRGSEPWEIQEVIEHRKIGDVKPPGP